MTYDYKARFIAEGRAVDLFGNGHILFLHDDLPIGNMNRPAQFAHWIWQGDLTGWPYITEPRKYALLKNRSNTVTALERIEQTCDGVSFATHGPVGPGFYMILSSRHDIVMMKLVLWPD